MKVVVCIKDVRNEDEYGEISSRRGMLYHVHNDEIGYYINSTFGDYGDPFKHYIYDSNNINSMEYFFEHFQVVKDEKE